MLRIKFFEAKDDESEKKKQGDKPASSKSVKDKEADSFDSSMFKPQKSQPVAKVDKPADTKSNTPSAEKPRADTPDIKKASAADTAKAMKGVSATDDMRDMMSRINVPDDMVADEPELDSDDVAGDEARPEPVNPDGVPALISREIAAAMPDTVDPQFHQVKNLPGYMSRAIRAMGRGTFKNYTDTPVEDISVIANLGGQGPNSEREINAVASWLKQNGTKLDASELGFGDMIPGYSAQTMLYSTAGMRFLVVKDFAGGYIYVWPEGSSSNALGSNQGSAKALSAPRDEPRRARSLAAPRSSEPEEYTGNVDDDLAALMKKYGV
jgi:hypothetical protein